MADSLFDFSGIRSVTIELTEKLRLTQLAEGSEKSDALVAYTYVCELLDRLRDIIDPHQLRQPGVKNPPLCDLIGLTDEKRQIPLALRRIYVDLECDFGSVRVEMRHTQLHTGSDVFDYLEPGVWWPGRVLDLGNTLTILDRILERFGALGDPLTDKLIPHWNRDAGELSISGELIRRYAEQATNCRRVLDAFEESGWPGRLDDRRSWETGNHCYVNNEGNTGVDSC